jgi:hypothetical protein
VWRSSRPRDYPEPPKGAFNARALSSYVVYLEKSSSLSGRSLQSAGKATQSHIAPIEGSTSSEREGLLAGPYNLENGRVLARRREIPSIGNRSCQRRLIDWAYSRCPLFGIRIGLRIMGRGQISVKKRMVSHQVRKRSAPAAVPKRHRRAPRSRAWAWLRRHLKKLSGVL